MLYIESSWEGSSLWEVWWWMPKVGKRKCWRGQSPAPKLLALPGWKSQYDWGICLGKGKKQEKMDFCCCSVTKLCPTLCNPMNATPCSLSISISLSLLKLMSVESVMPSSHLILCHPSSPALNLSQHQGLFQWVSSWHQMAKVLELQLHHQSFQWIFRVDLPYVWLVWSPCCPRASQESSIPELKSINSLALRLLYQMAKVLLNTQTSALAVLFILEQGVE